MSRETLELIKLLGKKYHNKLIFFTSCWRKLASILGSWALSRVLATAQSISISESWLRSQTISVSNFKLKLPLFRIVELQGAYILEIKPQLSNQVSPFLKTLSSNIEALAPSISNVKLHLWSQALKKKKTLLQSSPHILFQKYTLSLLLTLITNFFHCEINWVASGYQNTKLIFSVFSNCSTRLVAMDFTHLLSYPHQ